MAQRLHFFPGAFAHAWRTRGSAGRGTAAKLPGDITMKRRLLLLTCVLTLLVAGAAVAQMTDTTPAKPPGTMTMAMSTPEISVSGKVVSSTSTELAIDNDRGERMTFLLDPKTAPATTFTVGDRVTVQYHARSDNTMFQAARITVEPPVKVETHVAEVTTPAPAPLPATASGLPLIGLLGFLAVGGAV